MHDDDEQLQLPIRSRDLRFLQCGGAGSQSRRRRRRLQWDEA